MKVRVRIMGALSKPCGRGELDWQGRDAAAIEEVLLELGYRQEHLKFISAAVNSVTVPDLHASLKDGDELLLSMQIGGG